MSQENSSVRHEAYAWRGAILVYGPIKDEPDWIPIEGCMNDLLQAETTSAKELSELALQPWEREMCGAS